MAIAFFVVSQSYLIPRLAEALDRSREQARAMEADRLAAEYNAEQRQRHAERLGWAAALGNVLAALRQRDLIVWRVVREIEQAFDVYQVNLFLTDRTGEMLNLVAAAGAQGEALVENGYQIAVGTRLLPGRVAQIGREQTVLPLPGELAHFPESRVEVCFPLSVRGEILGVLDIHSEASAFTEEALQLFRIVTGYVTTSLDMVQLLEDSDARTQEMRALYAQYTQASWRALLEAGQAQSYAVGSATSPVVAVLAAEVVETLEPRSTWLDDEQVYLLIVPLVARDVALGYLAFTRSAEKGDWNADSRAVIGAAAERLALALDNTRLLVEARRQAVYDDQLSQLSAAIWETPSSEVIMEQTVRELGRFLGASDVQLYVLPGDDMAVADRARSRWVCVRSRESNMNLILGVQGLQLLAWLFALVELILAFYVLALNARHPANRHLSILVLFACDQQPGFGAVRRRGEPGTGNSTELSVCGDVVHHWAWRGRCRYRLAETGLVPRDDGDGRGARSTFFVFLLPVLTLIDFVFGTKLWYTGINVTGYIGGYLPLQNYVSPRFYVPAMIFYGYIAGLLPFFPIVATLRDKKTSSLMRQLAWIIFAAQVIILLIQGALRTVLPPVTKTFIGTAAYAIAYVYYRVPADGFGTPFAARAITFASDGDVPVDHDSRARHQRTVGRFAGAIAADAHRDGAVWARLRICWAMPWNSRTIQTANIFRNSCDLRRSRSAIPVRSTSSMRRIRSSLTRSWPSIWWRRMIRCGISASRCRSLRCAPSRGDDLVIFSDENGARWWGYSTEVRMKQWGVVVQQQEAVLAETMQQFMNLSWLVVGVGAILLSALGFLTIRQAFFPIVSLTETARAIAAGDLDREATIESEDEIGALARAFNSVTARLNASIGGLEERVAERTADVERRAEYLAITGGLSRVAASILDVDTLLDRVVNADFRALRLLSCRYLPGGRSRASGQSCARPRPKVGQRMLARAHRLRIGEEGIVGYVSGTGRPRIALDVDEDVVWAQNPDLPETRSEMALPLVIGEDVIGVLDVQSTAPQAFGEEDVATLRILADQIAVAIRNAQLFEESQRTLRELRRVYSAEARQGMGCTVKVPWWVIVTRQRAVQPLTSIEDKTMIEAEGAYVGEDNTLYVPMQLAGAQTFGYLQLQRDAAQPLDSA